MEEVDKFGGEGVKKLLVANRIDESNDRAVNYTLAKVRNSLVKHWLVMD